MFLGCWLHVSLIDHDSIAGNSLMIAPFICVIEKSSLIWFLKEVISKKSHLRNVDGTLSVIVQLNLS